MPIAELIKIPPVQAFLMDGSVMTVFETILEKFALPKERAVELLDLTDAVLDETLELDALPAMLVQAFGIEEERAKRFAADIAGFRLLPLEEYVPGVAVQITAWGGDLAKYPKSKVGKMKMNAETFATQLDEKLSLNFSEVLIKRCAFLLGAYWTGEKTKESTLTFFSRAQSIGGLGLAPEIAQNLLAAIDGSRSMVDVVAGGAMAAPDSDEKMLASGEMINSGEIAIQEIERTMGTQQDGVSSRALEVAPSHEVAAEVPVASAPKNDILDQRFSALTKSAAVEHIEPVLPGARVSIARTSQEETEQQAAAISREDIAQAAVANRPAPVMPMLTVGSVAPRHDMSVPVTDIQSVRRLVGPVDELGGMTPVEFRRLSTAPADAAQKIEDMLETLEHTSYEERVKGVCAWRTSPVHRLYITMVSSALAQGVSIAEVATHRRGAGEESLSPAEIRAIVGLNDRIRF